MLAIAIALFTGCSQAHLVNYANRKTSLENAKKVIIIYTTTATSKLIHLLHHLETHHQCIRTETYDFPSKCVIHGESTHVGEILGVLMALYFMNHLSVIELGDDD